MKRLKKLKTQLKREKASLEWIPLFSPIFKEAYGKNGRNISILLGAITYTMVVIYTQPWSAGYTNIERISLLVFVVLFGIFVFPAFPSFVVAFFFNMWDLVSWQLDMKLRLNSAMKFLIFLIPTLLIVGFVLNSDPNIDEWGIFCFMMTYIIGYFFVYYTWNMNYLYQQSLENTNNRKD